MKVSSQHNPISQLKRYCISEKLLGALFTRFFSIHIIFLPRFILKRAYLFRNVPTIPCRISRNIPHSHVRYQPKGKCPKPRLPYSGSMIGRSSRSYIKRTKSIANLWKTLWYEDIFHNIIQESESEAFRYLFSIGSKKCLIWPSSTRHRTSRVSTSIRERRRIKCRGLCSKLTRRQEVRIIFY